jgi:beta-glucosidase
MKPLTILFLAILSLTSSGQTAPQLTGNNIDEVVNAMTLEEKVHLCVGIGSFWMGARNKGDIPGAAGGTYAIPRLGIPSVYMADGPLGVRISNKRKNDSMLYNCTGFPVPLLVGSTWDIELAEEASRAMAEEAREYGIDVLLGPSINIERDPLCGRNHEYYSEDPLLSGKLASAFIRGAQSYGVGTSLKHFAANNQETNRKANDVRVSQRALREIYLKGFEIAVKEAAPWTVMTSYNKINGEYTSEYKELLEDVLRGEWGFNGMVMTDWGAGVYPVAQMSAGNDLIQPGDNKQYTTILEAVRNGKLSEEIIDRNVKRILSMIVKTPRFNNFKATAAPDLPGHAALIRKIAAEGSVLLKNEKTLPVSHEVKKVALYGCTAYNLHPGGISVGEYNTGGAYTISLPEGLKNAGYIVDSTLTTCYINHLTAEDKRIYPKGKPMVNLKRGEYYKEIALSDTQLQADVSDNDMAIIVLGQNAGENEDRKVTDFYLTQEEQSLISGVSEKFHRAGKKVVVIQHSRSG